MALTDGEKRELANISGNVQRVRVFFESVAAPPADAHPEAWLRYLIEMKRVMGNTSNWLSLTACLLAKEHLDAVLPMAEFDVALKPQGAPGLDIDAMTIHEERVVGEVKTTIPYNQKQQRLGAAQQSSIRKDVAKLLLADAKHKFLFVTDDMTYHAVAHAFATQLGAIQLVLLGAGDQEQ